MYEQLDKEGCDVVDDELLTKGVTISVRSSVWNGVISCTRS